MNLLFTGSTGAWLIGVQKIMLLPLWYIKYVYWNKLMFCRTVITLLSKFFPHLIYIYPHISWEIIDENEQLHGNGLPFYGISVPSLCSEYIILCNCRTWFFPKDSVILCSFIYVGKNWYANSWCDIAKLRLLHTGIFELVSTAGCPNKSVIIFLHIKMFEFAHWSR